MAVQREVRPGAWSDELVLRLVREHERLVRSYLRSLGCRPDRVEDLAQETFLRLFSRPATELDATALRGTLCVTARNLYFNTMRADAARPKLEEIERAWVEYDGGDGGSSYLEALRGCLERLPSRTREALRLRFGANVSRTEIAARLKLSLGGVKSLLLRAKHDLRDCMRRRLGPGSIDSVDSAEATP